MNVYKCIYRFTVTFPQGAAGSGAVPALRPGAAWECWWVPASGDGAVPEPSCRREPGSHPVPAASRGSHHRDIRTRERGAVRGAWFHMVRTH